MGDVVTRALVAGFVVAVTFVAGAIAGCAITGEWQHRRQT